MVSYQTIGRNSMNAVVNTDGSDCDYDYEEVETLSLCDLPIYSSSGGGGSFESKEGDHSLSSDDQEDDFFEFFSGEFDSTTYDGDNVMFCGKLIPYKIPHAHQIINKNDQLQQLPIKKQRQRFFRWTSRRSTTESRILSDTTPKKCQANSDEKSKRCGVASANNKKIAGELILTSSTKSKWHMFLFGLTRIPTEMELSDMRNRQHRRRTTSPLVKYSSFHETKKDKDVTRKANKKKTSCTTSGKGLWKLLKVLCCKNKVSVGGI